MWQRSVGGTGFGGASHTGQAIRWVLYAYELDKVLFRIELAGIEVYSVLSVREYSDYYQEERIMAKTMMVIAQLAMMGGTTVFAVADELRATGAFDNLTAGQGD